MKSKIRVEFDFDKKEPYIQFYLEKETEEQPDLRDSMLKALIQEASYEPLWIWYPPSNADNSVPQLRIQDAHTFITSMETWCLRRLKEKFGDGFKEGQHEALNLEINEFFGKITGLLK